jgi:hypothetical protein
MKYRKIDAKYDLPEPDSRLLAVHGFDIDTPRIRLTPDGMMTLKQFYTWDGASGPTIDTVDTISPSAYHDAGYELIELGLVPLSYKEYFDGLLYLDMLRTGHIMVQIETRNFPKIIRPIYVAFRERIIKNRANTWYQAVSAFGGGSCKPGNINPILEAP